MSIWSDLVSALGFGPRVRWKTGIYIIQPLSTTTYTFWWPYKVSEDESVEKGFFDVSIRVAGAQPPNDIVTPLLEVKREYTKEFEFVREDEDTLNPSNHTVLYLTLRNDNDFAILFWAAHLLIN